MSGYGQGPYGITLPYGGGLGATDLGAVHVENGKTFTRVVSSSGRLIQSVSCANGQVIP